MLVKGEVRDLDFRLGGILRARTLGVHREKGACRSWGVIIIAGRREVYLPFWKREGDRALTNAQSPGLGG